MTVDDLAVDSTFLAFAAAWEAEGRCPLAAVDYLLEQGLEAEAEALRWAATADDITRIECVQNTPTLGVYPCCCSARFIWYQRAPESGQSQVEQCRLPHDVMNGFLVYAHASFLDAVLNLLRMWAKARPLEAVS